jgi:hypothetical protein
MVQFTQAKDWLDLASDQDLAMKRVRALVEDLRAVCELEAHLLRDEKARRHLGSDEGRKCSSNGRHSRS